MAISTSNGSGFGNGIENAGVVFGGDFAGRIGIDVEDSGELDLSGFGQFGVKARVILSQ